MGDGVAQFSGFYSGQFTQTPVFGQTIDRPSGRALGWLLLLNHVDERIAGDDVSDQVFKPLARYVVEPMVDSSGHAAAQAIEESTPRDDPVRRHRCSKPRLADDSQRHHSPPTHIILDGRCPHRLPIRSW